MMGDCSDEDSNGTVIARVLDEAGFETRNFTEISVSLVLQSQSMSQ